MQARQRQRARASHLFVTVGVQQHRLLKVRRHTSKIAAHRGSYPLDQSMSLLTERLAIDESAGFVEGSSDTTIRIADVVLALSTDDPGLKLHDSAAIKKFLVAGGDPDIRIRAGWSDLSTEPAGKKIFDSGGVWQLYIEDDTYRFRFYSSRFGLIPYKEASFNRDFSCGEIALHRPYFTAGYVPFPLEYPLDELLMMHLLARGRGVEVHACGVVDDSGNGHLFIGQSGAGKTTMARLWENKKNITILSDDRIVLRRINNTIWMYGTPWHGEAGLSDPSRAALTRIYFLRQGQKNQLQPQAKSEAVARLFACSFPPFYSSEALNFTLEFIAEIVEAVPCDELSFVPDRRVVDLVVGTQRTEISFQRSAVGKSAVA